MMDGGWERVFHDVLVKIKQDIAENLARSGFTGGSLDASHVSGVGSSGLLHSATSHVAGTLGQLLYAGAVGAWAALAGNTTATRKFLRQTGTGAVSAAPAWDTIIDGDLPTTLAGKTLTTATLTAPTIADFTNASHDHGDADDGGALNNALMTGYIEGAETTDPAAPAADKGRLYFRDNGSGKTQLVVLFPTGAIQVISTEP